MNNFWKKIGYFIMTIAYAYLDYIIITGFITIIKNNEELTLEIILLLLLSFSLITLALYSCIKKFFF